MGVKDFRSAKRVISDTATGGTQWRMDSAALQSLLADHRTGRGISTVVADGTQEIMTVSPTASTFGHLALAWEQWVTRKFALGNTVLICFDVPAGVTAAKQAEQHKRLRGGRVVEPFAGDIEYDTLLPPTYAAAVAHRPTRYRFCDWLSMHLLAEGVSRVIVPSGCTLAILTPFGVLHETHKRAGAEDMVTSKVETGELFGEADVSMFALLPRFAKKEDNVVIQSIDSDSVAIGLLFKDVAGWVGNIFVQSFAPTKKDDSGKSLPRTREYIDVEKLLGICTRQWGDYAASAFTVLCAICGTDFTGQTRATGLSTESAFSSALTKPEVITYFRRELFAGVDADGLPSERAIRGAVELLYEKRKRQCARAKPMRLSLLARVTRFNLLYWKRCSVGETPPPPTEHFGFVHSEDGLRVGSTVCDTRRSMFT